MRRSAMALPVIILLCACTDNSRSGREGAPAEQGRMVESPALPETFGLGSEPSAARIASVDIDANPAGVGLPPGSGTYAKGAALFTQKCAACHGMKGEGMGPYPQLIGVDHQRDFSFANDPNYPKTIGNYWPYATTIYDYVHRAMPLPAPGSLQPDEVYSLVAFLLAENGIVPRTTIIDRQSLPQIMMPSRGRFVPDDRTGGASFR